MKIIAEIIGGSHLYGLSTPESDVDKRGVFLNTEPGKILGLERFEVIKQRSEDTLYFELVHYLRGLRKTNTQMIELLFAQPKSFTILTEEFNYIRNNKYKLIDSNLFHKSLCGYIQNEKRLATGERTGNLGSKRNNAVELYGFSPKNFSHLLRLAYCGKTFFQTDHYPTDIRQESPEFGQFLFDIKTDPKKFDKKFLEDVSNNALKELQIAFDNRNNNFEFDLNFANQICLNFYKKFILFSLPTP